MKIIKPSATLLKHNVTPYQFIERVGRLCYKSEDKIKEGSDKVFVKNLVRREHWAMLEHETIYLSMSEKFMRDFLTNMDYEDEKLTFFNMTRNPYLDIYILSGSFRSFHDLFEMGYNSKPLNFIKAGLQFAYPLVFGEAVDFSSDDYDYGKYDCVMLTRDEFMRRFSDREDILFSHLTHTFKFVCDRGVSHELVRHRVASFAQESTRYCNYGKDNEITVIDPFFWESKPEAYTVWKIICEDCEMAYLNLLSGGYTPQEARAVLPNSLKTEIVVTATEKEWQHIVNLRYLGTTGAPHPQMKEVMSLAIQDLAMQSGGRIKVVKGEK